jgi:hypothetical protein
MGLYPVHARIARLYMVLRVDFSISPSQENNSDDFCIDSRCISARGLHACIVVAAACTHHLPCKNCKVESASCLDLLKESS